MYYSNKKIVLIWFFIFLLNGANAQKGPSLKLSLPEVWERVMQNSKTIRMQDLKVQRSLEGIKHAKAERLPEITAEGEYAKITNLPIYNNGLFHTPDQFEGLIHTTYSFGGEAYLNLFQGGKITTKIAEEKKESEIAAAQKILTTEEMKLQATAFYLDLERSRIFKNLLQKDISTQEKQLEEIKQLLKNGVVLKSDVLRGTLKLSRQKMSLVQLDNDILIANQKLNILAGLPDETVIEVSEGDENEMPALRPYEEYLGAAIDHSPAYRISEKEAELSKLNIKSVKSNGSVRLGLFSNYSYAYPQIQIFPYAAALYGLGFNGIKASYPISALYHNRHKVKAAEIRYQEQELEHEHTTDKLRIEVNQAFLRYREALTRIDVAKENISQATENLRIVNNTYFNQLSLITDLLDADTQLLQTRFDYASARIAARLQYYQLQKAIGNL